MSKMNHYFKSMEDYLRFELIEKTNLQRDLNYYPKEHKISVTLDLLDLMEYDVDLYEYLMEDFEYSGMNFLLAIAKSVFNREVLFVVENVPNASNHKISNVRTKDISSFKNFKGMVKRKSNVFSKTYCSEYQCENPACSQGIEPFKVYYKGEQVEEVKKCSKCQSKVSWVKDYEKDYQLLTLEELSEDLPNSNIQPKTITVHVSEPLTDIRTEGSVLIGNKVEICSTIKQQRRKEGHKPSVYSDFYLNAYNVKSLEENLDDIKLTPQDIKQILELSQKENIKDILVNSTATEICGNENEKLSLLISILGGNVKSSRRSNIHTLFLGDPSKAKSRLLKFVDKLMPRTKYVSGEGSSGVGLTASAVKDELSGGWTAEAGAIVHANNGILLLDELDKIRLEEQTKLNTALEDGEVPLDKAGISAKLKANATVIASANPKMGRFDMTKDMAKQISIDKALLSRFDMLIFLLDTQNTDEDTKIASFIFNELEEDKESIELDMLRKYIIYAKKLTPKHTRESASLLQEYYVNLRKQTAQHEINITVRQLEGLKRMSEAIAKLHLRTEVTEKDSELAIELMNFSMKHFKESEILTGISNNTRSIYKAVEEYLEFTKEENIGEFTFEDILNYVNGVGISLNKTKLDDIIIKMKNEGLVFEPRKNKYKAM